MNSLDTSVEAEPAEQRRDILRQYIYDILLGAGPEGMISDEVREQMAARYNVHSYSSSTARYKEMYDYVGKRKGRSRRNQRIMVANKEWKDVHENME
jgi:hypothetical protein